MKYLIINADDFGLNSSVNKGIMAAFQAGAITGATLMVKRRGSEEALDILKNNPSLPIGLHLDLDDILAADKKEVLRFSPARIAGLLGKKEIRDRIEQEIDEQIDAFRRHSASLTHLDSHHHLHAVPEIFEIVVKKMSENGIKTLRIARRYDLIKYSPIIWDGFFYDKARRILADKGIATADHFLAEIRPEMLDNIKSGVTEVMTHPSVNETWRRRDLDVLTSERWKESIRINRLKLISFRDLYQIGIKR